MTNRWFAGMCVAVAGLSVAATPVVGQQPYPNATVRIVTPFGGGSGSDTVARVLGAALQAQMGVAVVTEVREGAGGQVGAASVAKAEPDGYTLLSAATPTIIAPYMSRNPAYNPNEDFVTIARIAVIPMVLVTSANGPYKSFDDLTEKLRSSRGQVLYATGGPGSTSHLEVELFLRALGLSAQAVPYKSLSQGLVDTMAGRLDFALSSFPSVQGQVKAGDMRALAIGMPDRVSLMPEAPTFAEVMKKPGYEASIWYGLLAPKGTPPEIVKRLIAEVQKAMADPATQARLQGVGGILTPLYGLDFAAQIKAENDKWSRIIKDLNIALE